MEEKKDILVLLIQEESVNALIYQLEEEGLRIKGLGEEQDWDGKTYASFEQAVAGSLGSRLQKKELGIKRTFFVISPFWTLEAQKLMESKADLLKTLCREYRWPAGGFVIDDESLIFHFEKKEEVPPSFISLLLLKNGFRLSLVHLGKVKKRLKLSSATVSAQKIREGLDQLGFEGVLPPKFIIWGKASQELEEDMLSYPWVDDRGDLFLHLPDIQVLDWPQLGEILKEIIASQLEESEEQKEKTTSKKIKERYQEPAETEALPAGFSFQDLSSEKEIKEEENKEEKKLSPSPKINKININFPFKNKFLFLSSIFPRSLSKVRIVLAIGLLLLMGGLFAFGFFGLKQEVVLYLTPQELESENEVSLSAKAVVGEDYLIASELSYQEEAEGQEVATGTNLIGERASGKVVIYNRTDKQAGFDQGTKIIGPNDLTFSLLEEAKVASKTPDLVSGVDRWGEKAAAVEALQIGSQYNLASDSLFSIEGEKEGDFLIRNKEALSGGSSREVSAVSPDDLVRLKADLEKKLEAKIERGLAEQVQEGQIFVTETAKTEIISFLADKKEGEEAEDFSGQLALKSSGLAIDQKDLAAFAQSKLAPKVPEGLELSSDELEIKFLPIEETESGFLGKVTIKAKFYPQPDLKALRSDLKGLARSQVLERLKKIPRVYRYELNTPIKLFSSFPWLPLKESNIIVRVEH
ncbi:MAG: hypothetical protein ABIB61_03620 [Candidatus Shapirobacteria bacterium]